jgi:hypothetical protein
MLDNPTGMWWAADGSCNACVQSRAKKIGPKEKQRKGNGLEFVMTTSTREMNKDWHTDI